MPMPWERDWSGAASGGGGGALPWQRNWSGQVEELPAQTVQPDQNVKHGLSAFWDQINPLNVVNSLATAVSDPKATAKALYNAQADRLRQARDLWGQRRYSEAAGNALAGAIPLVGPAAAAIGEQMGGTDPKLDRYGNVIEPGRAPDPVGALGSGAGLLTMTLAAPQIAKQTAKGAKWAGRSFAKSALGLSGKAEAFGAEPAVAVLEETRGFRPSKIAETGQARLNQLRGQQETLVNNATVEPSLGPPVLSLRTRANAARAANSADTVNELQPMIDQLTEPRQGFAGNRAIDLATGKETIAPNQPASQYLAMQRAFNTDHVTNWNPTAQTRGKLGAARQAYHEMRKELDRAVPGLSEVNDRMHSLIPAVERAEQVSRHAGLLEHVLNRVARPTGGLIPALFGMEHAGGAGFAAGLGLPEAISLPLPRMAAARGAWGTGKALNAAATQRAAQLLPILGLLSDEYGSAGYNPQQ